MKFATVIIFLWVVGSVLARQTKPAPFLINGYNTTNVPCYAYLEIFRQSNFRGPTMYFGGGTLINSHHILTVAQNVDGFKSWRIGMGSNRITEMDWFYTIEGVTHPDYNRTDLANNIAVLRLMEPITINNRIRPVIIFPMGLSFPAEGSASDMVGFGFGGIDEQPSVLQHTLLTVTSEDECSDAYPHLRDNGQLANHFCAVNRQSHSNICAGDQGGPFYDPMLNLLLGIGSFYRLNNCDLPGAQPPAFIRVTAYIGWINSVQFS